MKKFFEWILLKEKLDSTTSTAPFVSEGDIWWISLGENIGQEMGGRNEFFSRPAIIFKKLAKNLYLIVPLTTQEHIGNWFHSFVANGRIQYACLHQVRVIDHRRLRARLGKMGTNDFLELAKAFSELYINSPPPLRAEVAASAE